MSNNLSKDNIDQYLKEVAKEFRKLNGKKITAEIVIVGGASIVLNYGFRDSTIDIDAVLKAGSSMKDAIRKVEDEHNLVHGWINDDFKSTSSYSDNLPLYAKYYKTFSNVVRVYTISGKYLIAMKLMSGRSYKFDQSDVIGILYSHRMSGNDITLEDIKEAAKSLYGSYEDLPETSRSFVEKLFSYDRNLEDIYNEQVREEQNNKQSLIEFEEQYEGILNKDNVDDILALLK